MSLFVTIAEALVGSIPRIIELVQSGRNPADISLTDLLSSDALAKLEEARSQAEEYVRTGQ